MRLQGCSQLLALLMYGTSTVSGDSKVGPGECTWDASPTYTGQTLVFNRVASGLSTLGSCRTRCEEAENEVRLVGYEFGSESCKCFLATGLTSASPDGTTAVRLLGGCYATRPSVWCAGINQRVALAPQGRALLTTHAYVKASMKPVAHKQFFGVASAAACVCAAFETQWIWGQSTHAHVESHWAGVHTSGVGFDYATRTCSALYTPLAVGLGMSPSIARAASNYAAYGPMSDGTSMIWAASVELSSALPEQCGDQSVELTTYFGHMISAAGPNGLERPDANTNRIRMSVEHGFDLLRSQMPTCHHISGWVELEPEGLVSGGPAHEGTNNRGVILGVLSGQHSNYVAVEGYGTRHAVNFPISESGRIVFTIDRRGAPMMSTLDTVSMWLTLCCAARPSYSSASLPTNTCPALGFSHATGAVAWKQASAANHRGVDSSFSVRYAYSSEEYTDTLETDVSKCCEYCVDSTQVTTPPPSPPPMPPPEWGLCVDDCAVADAITGIVTIYTNNGVCDVPTHCGSGRDCSDCGKAGTYHRSATDLSHPTLALRSTPSTNTYATITSCWSSSQMDVLRSCAKAFDGCHAPYQTNVNAELQATWHMLSDIHPQRIWCLPYNTLDGTNLPFSAPVNVMGFGYAMVSTIDECERICHAPCNAITWHRVTRKCTFYASTHSWANGVLPADADWSCNNNAEFAWKRTETDCSHGQLLARGVMDDHGVAWAALEATPHVVFSLNAPTSLNGMRYANRWQDLSSAVRNFTVTLYDKEMNIIGSEYFYHHCYTYDGYVTHPDEPWRGCVDTEARWDILKAPSGVYAIPVLANRGTNVDAHVANGETCSSSGGTKCTYTQCQVLCDASSSYCHAVLWFKLSGGGYKCHFYSNNFEFASATLAETDGLAMAYTFRRGPKSNDFDKHIFRFERAYALVATVRVDILSTWGNGFHPGAREVEFGYYTVGRKLDDGLAAPPPPAPLGKCSSEATNRLGTSHLASKHSTTGAQSQCSTLAGLDNIGQDKPYMVEFDIDVTTAQLQQMQGNWSTLFSMGSNLHVDAVLLGLTADLRLFHKWAPEGDAVGGLQSPSSIVAGTHRLVFQFDGHLRSTLLNGIVVATDEPLATRVSRRRRKAIFPSVVFMCKMSYRFVGSLSQLRIYDGVPCVGNGLTPGTSSPPAAPPPPPPLRGDDSLTAYWRFDGDDPLADVVHGHRLVRLGGACAASDSLAQWTHVRDRHHVNAIPTITGAVLGSSTHSLNACQAACDTQDGCYAIMHNAADDSCTLFGNSYDLRTSKARTDLRHFYIRDCSEFTPGWARLGGHGTQLVLDGSSQYMHMAFPDTPSHTDRESLTIDNHKGFTTCAIASTVKDYEPCDQADGYSKCYPVLMSNGEYPGAASASEVGNRGWSVGMNRRMCRCGSAKQHLAAWGPHHTSVQLGGVHTDESEAQALAEYDDPSKTSFDGVFTGRRSNSLFMEDGTLWDVDDLTWGVRRHDTRIH